MPIETLLASKNVIGPGAETFDTTIDANYTTTAGSVTGSNVTLALKIYYPTLSDPETPRPVVFIVSGGGYSLSSSAFFPTQAQYIAEMGAICVVVEYRIMGDDPLDTGSDASQNVLRRTIRAVSFDIDEAIKYTLANYLEYESGGDRVFSIEPSWMFLLGQSQGGISSLQYVQDYPTRKIIGIIVFASAFGGDGLTVSGETATDILRGQLKYTEDHHHIPVCAFLGGADTTIGTTYIESFRTRLGAIGGSIVHYDADGDHSNTGVGLFDTNDIVGASTEEEAIYNFIRDRCANSPNTSSLRQQGAAWSRRWVKLQSRFW